MISSVVLLLRVPIFSSSLDLSNVAIWLTTATLDFGRLAVPFLSRTFQGTEARFMFDVMIVTIVVLILLLFNKSF
jgi:hypothetical protein